MKAQQRNYDEEMDALLKLAEEASALVAWSVPLPVAAQPAVRILRWVSTQTSDTGVDDANA
jgi:hypothetical protein